MRSRYLLLFWLAAAVVACAQIGPCTEAAVRKGELPAADNAFNYMPAYSKPAATRSEVEQANKENFSDRINRTFEWADDHHVGASASGDMAFEHGTMHVSYETKSDGKHHSFDAVMLMVYQAKGSVCQQVALTMYPLEDTVK